jgi:acyltransferase
MGQKTIFKGWQMRNRILWVDTLRAIGISFIVLVHTGRFNDPFVLMYLKSFFVPLFFFVSGLVAQDSLYKDSFPNFLANLSRRLLLPYVFFATISYLLWLLLLRHFKSQFFDPLKSLLGILYGSGSWISYNGALWFFTCLFIAQIMFFFLVRSSQHRPHLFLLPFLLFCLSVAGYLLTTYVTASAERLPWSIDIALTATVFYGVGYLLRSYVLTVNFAKWRWPAVLISLATHLCFARMNKTVEFYNGDYGNYFYFYMAAFSGILFWTHIAYLIKPHPLFSEIGQNTLVIFSTHLLVIPCLTGFLIHVLHIERKALDDNLSVALGYVVFSMIATLMISRWMREHTPVLLGRSARRIQVQE